MMRPSDFIKGVEKMINPIDIGTLHFMQNFNDFLPAKLQKKIIKKSSKETPFMGFVVEPYSFYLCYELTDLKRAQELLPEGFKLMKTKVFKEDEPKFYGLFGCFNAHTSGFWGLRVEFYLVAENIETGLISWIIVDYDTNTITYDPKNGLSQNNSNKSYLTIDYNGNVYMDITSDADRRLKFDANIKDASFKALDEKLWIEGNLSIAYGQKKSDSDPGLFSLIFNSGEFKEALEIDVEKVLNLENNWYSDIIASIPDKALCFPYSQHFLSDSPGYTSNINNREDMLSVLNGLDFNAVRGFSTAKFKRTMFIFVSVMIWLNVILILLNIF